MENRDDYRVETLIDATQFGLNNVKGIFKLLGESSISDGFTAPGGRTKLYIILAERGLFIAKFAAAQFGNEYELHELRREGPDPTQPEFTVGRGLEIGASCGFAALGVASIFAGPAGWIVFANALVSMADCVVAVTCGVQNARGEDCYFEKDRIGKRIRLGISVAGFAVSIREVASTGAKAINNAGQSGLALAETTAFNAAKLALVEIPGLAIDAYNLLDGIKTDLSVQELERLVSDREAELPLEVLWCAPPPVDALTCGPHGS